MPAELGAKRCALKNDPDLHSEPEQDPRLPVGIHISKLWDLPAAGVVHPPIPTWFQAH